MHPQRMPILHQHQFDAAAPDIKQQVWTTIEPKSVLRGLENQPRLVNSGNNFDLEAGLAADSTDEPDAVFRLADRAGRNRPQPVHFPYPSQAPEILQRPDR